MLLAVTAHFNQALRLWCAFGLCVVNRHLHCRTFFSTTLCRSRVLVRGHCTKNDGLTIFYIIHHLSTTFSTSVAISDSFLSLLCGDLETWAVLVGIIVVVHRARWKCHVAWSWRWLTIATLWRTCWKGKDKRTLSLKKPTFPVWAPSSQVLPCPQLSGCFRRQVNRKQMQANAPKEFWT